MYCEKCCHVFEADCCPVCGNKKVRMPEAKDPCFLIEKDCLSSGMVEDVLKQNGIPFLAKNVLGAGLAIKIGPMLERSRFYVPYAHFQDASAVVTELFSVAEDNGEP